MTRTCPRAFFPALLALVLLGCDVADDGDGAAVDAAAPTDVAPKTAPATAPDLEPHAGGQHYAPRWDGFGPATFGMSADQVRAAWKGDLGDEGMEEPACFHLSPTSQPEYAYFAMMFGDGRFVRYSSSNDAMSAPGGGRRGMSAVEIEAIHPGRVEHQPHKYSDGEYLRVEGDGGRVLVFETDGDGTVTEWRVGVPPYVDYVEGCA